MNLTQQITALVERQEQLHPGSGHVTLRLGGGVWNLRLWRNACVNTHATGLNLEAAVQKALELLQLREYLVWISTMGVELVDLYAVNAVNAALTYARRLESEHGLNIDGCHVSVMDRATATVHHMVVTHANGQFGILEVQQ